MQTNIYTGRITRVTWKHPYSPVGFTNIIETLDGRDWNSSDGESSSWVANHGPECEHYEKILVDGVEIIYDFDGKNEAGRYSGVVKFVLESDNAKRMSEIEKTIRKCISTREHCQE